VGTQRQKPISKTPVEMKIFITGNPGSGKSTLIKRILDHISGKKVAGIITPEIKEGGKRQGFKIIDLASGKEEILASLNIERGPGVSRYRVNVHGVDLVLEEFLRSYRDSEYVVIDEIGMMEFYSNKFKDTVEMVLDSDKMMIATLSKRFVGEYQGKGDIYHLTRGNFDEIFSRIMNQLEL
jgi:nucleoside-triphosphatase